MLDLLTSPYFLLFARLCVGGVFLASGLGKLLDKTGTATSLSRYPFLPVGSRKMVANYFPFLELLVGALLVLGLFTRMAAILAVGLFVFFTGLILYDLSRGNSRSCHCFGRLSDERLTPMAVVRNVALIALALAVAAAFDGWLALDSALGASAGGASFPTAIDAVPIALLAILAVGVIVLGGQMVSMVRATLRGIGF